MKTNNLVIMALFAKATEAETVWTYTDHGSDWDLDFPSCGDSNQSPINLITVERTASDFEYVVYDESKDEFLKSYTNQVDNTVTWDGHTSEVVLDGDTNGVSSFQSNLGEQFYGADLMYEASSFVFHAGSEHTINGERKDMEMQTMHVPAADAVANDIVASIIGVLFSVDDSTAELTEAEVEIIDTFFQSLQWDTDLTTDPIVDPVVDLISYGNLMELIDMNNRWIYKGSKTTPPCETVVYWNVLSTVYPIKQEHLDLFVTHQEARTSDTPDLAEVGNWREIQNIDQHNVTYVASTGRISQKITNLFKGASTYLSVGVAAVSAYVAATI